MQRMDGKMSDTQKELQKDVVAREPAPPPSSGPARTSQPGTGGKVLASLALLAGLAGAGAGGYSFWLQQQQIKRLDAQAAELAGLQQGPDQSRYVEQLDVLARQQQQLGQRLERLPSLDDLDERRRLLASLQSEQQNLATRVDRVLGASREDWRLAEAEHLLRMAMLRLSAMQDAKSAAALLNEADLILQRQNDPGAYAARAKLVESLEALRSLPDFDRTGLFLQLAALRSLGSKLTALAPQFHLGDAPADEAPENRWQRWLNELERYVRIDLDAVSNVKPLLAGQSLGQVRLALSLAIEQAQWAVLNANTEVYRQSLAQARALLTDYFNPDDLESQALARRIDDIAQRQITAEMPDLTPALRALEAYIAEREKASHGLQEQARQSGIQSANGSQASRLVLSAGGSRT